ncbi:MAG: hypothetical protein K8H84_14425, partial [Sulfuricella denitrificans]|nr:hypothetical protein [Sulfuricella denitrificans]
EPPPSFGARIRTDFICGMGKVGGRFVILLNVSRVLSVDELAMLDQVGQENGMVDSLRLASAPN